MKKTYYEIKPDVIAERNAEINAFNDFLNAESGYFNGFDFVNAFHANYNKVNALEVLASDDCANIVTSKGYKIHVGADGITVYLMTTEAVNGVPKKFVEFNRSIYIF